MSPTEGDLKMDGTSTSSTSRFPQKTLIIYSGPTSTDRTQDKNGMYIDNMDYFLEHGVSCPNEQPHVSTQAEPVNVSYVFVVTQEVADYYTAPDGLVTKKRRECQHAIEVRGGSSTESAQEYIKVLVRRDRCYDMESMRVVLDQMDVQRNYDNLLFLNCGLVGPKFGPGSPTHIPSSTKRNKNTSPKMVPYSHWSQIYTSRLSDSLRIVGHSINTHFHTYFPHVQSFLYAIRTETVPLLLSSGAIYDCGLTQDELASDSAKRFELIQRYEVGMSTQLLKRGYQIGTAFINRWGMGTPLVLDQNSTRGMELDDTICDIWYEDGVRNLTKTVDKSLKWWDNANSTLRRKEDSFDYHQWDILPWDHFLFFKVSRLVPEDIQAIMHYNHLELVDVAVVPNDPRKSQSEFWQRKTREFDQRQGGIPAQNVMIAVILVLIGYCKRKQIEMRLRVLRKQIVSRNVRED